MPFCNQCGADTAGVQFCSKCGAPSGGGGAGASPSGSSGGSSASSGKVDSKLFGALAYVTFIPAVLFLILEPYKNDRFVRFHSFQCLFFTVAAIVIQIVFGILIMVTGGLLAVVSPLISLAFLVLWILLIVKAYQGQEYRLPMIGDLAAKQA